MELVYKVRYKLVFVFKNTHRSCIIKGCGCTYTPFGCCPDNVTVARGPDNTGCGCQYTEHKCCPDNFTPASGPQYQGCSCNTYQFGCCSDGITKAIGPNSEGIPFEENYNILTDIYYLLFCFRLWL